MILFNIIAIFISLINIGSGNVITIQAISNNENNIDNILSLIQNEFNHHSEKNNLKIKFEINSLSSDNSTISTTDYESSIETLLERKTPKYDLYFYDNIYTTKFGPYLLNLNDEIQKEIIDLYKPGIASQICVYNNEWVGLPLNIDFSVLYSNSKYLNKYNLPIPQTWDELIETCKFI
ncbi:hypothetical protein PIROE2DRAFT_14142 [Piromyces sp. E2]|nr:hypothetical protein PIROE2DRAFT_14142 [Piromyces sp. E2]|eukprot:OUM60151.1 hypothetical protein PIROE2DRAFT_14142 [Piromyces sp. E2]